MQWSVKSQSEDLISRRKKKLKLLQSDKLSAVKIVFYGQIASKRELGEKHQANVNFCFPDKSSTPKGTQKKHKNKNPHFLGFGLNLTPVPTVGNGGTSS